MWLRGWRARGGCRSTGSQRMSFPCSSFLASDGKTKSNHSGPCHSCVGGKRTLVAIPGCVQPRVGVRDRGGGATRRAHAPPLSPPRTL
jgi:hypothetical protein